MSTLKICCTNPECGKESKISDPYSSESKSLNARSDLAMREIRRGSKYMQTFFGMMDMLPPVHTHSSPQGGRGDRRRKNGKTGE